MTAAQTNVLTRHRTANALQKLVKYTKQAISQLYKTVSHYYFIKLYKMIYTKFLL